MPRRNPLSIVSRWKIFDNLRRSLSAPGLLLLFASGWVFLPGSPWAWTAAGLVVAVVDLLERDPDPSEATVREALSGNLCRCTGYQKILDAVRLAAERLRQAAPA